MDRLTSMAVFVRAADLGSFAATGGALGLSPQMVAKHVAALEARLGMRLITRTTRRQNLTEFGVAYRERCRLVLAEVEVADSLAGEARARPRGRLRVNAPVTFGTQCLTPMLVRFLRRYPEVEAHLALSDRMVDPVEDGFEAVFRLGPLADSHLIARPLRPYRLVACASPAYLAEHGTPREPADLARHECLGFAYWAPTLGRAWRFSKEGRSVEAPVHGRLQANDARALLQAALDGFGITLGAETAMAGELAAGRLVQILPDYEGPQRPMHLVYPADRHATPKLRCFIEAVLTEFGEHSR